MLMIPPDFGFGEWDMMWQGEVFFIYNNIGGESKKQSVQSKYEFDVMKTELNIGIGGEDNGRADYLKNLRSRLKPFGLEVWKRFEDYDSEYNGYNIMDVIEITRYTFFKGKDKLHAFRHMFPNDDYMELHMNAHRKWDDKYEIVSEELDYECIKITFERSIENRELFWEEAISIFPKEDDLDIEDINRRRKVFIQNGVLELLMMYYIKQSNYWK